MNCVCCLHRARRITSSVCAVVSILIKDRPQQKTIYSSSSTASSCVYKFPQISISATDSKQARKISDELNEPAEDSNLAPKYVSNKFLLVFFQNPAPVGRAGSPFVSALLRTFNHTARDDHLIPTPLVATSKHLSRTSSRRLPSALELSKADRRHVHAPTHRHLLVRQAVVSALDAVCA